LNIHQTVPPAVAAMSKPAGSATFHQRARLVSTKFAVMGDADVVPGGGITRAVTVGGAWGTRSRRALNRSG
jgi:hypothetical protein